MRQVTTEAKAVFLLQRYGISKLLLGIKNHTIDGNKELAKLIEDLV